MCGIVAYVGSKDSAPILVEGLRRLEYRGYDSAGLAVHTGRGVDYMPGMISTMVTDGSRACETAGEGPSKEQEGEQRQRSNSEDASYECAVGLYVLLEFFR